MKLETPRLYLRKLQETDAPLLVRLYGDPRVNRFLHQEREVTEESERAVIARHLKNVWDVRGSGLMAVFRKEDDAFVGCCGHLFWTVDGAEETEVAYAILPEYWRKGYASEAAQALRDDAFARLGVDRVISLIHVENAGSEGVARRNGMVPEKATQFKGFPIRVWVALRAPAVLESDS